MGSTGGPQPAAPASSTTTQEAGAMTAAATRNACAGLSGGSARRRRALHVREVAVAAAIARSIRTADATGLRHWQEELRLLHRQGAHVH